MRVVRRSTPAQPTTTPSSSQLLALQNGDVSSGTPKVSTVRRILLYVASLSLILLLSISMLHLRSSSFHYILVHSRIKRYQSSHEGVALDDRITPEDDTFSHQLGLPNSAHSANPVTHQHLDNTTAQMNFSSHIITKDGIPPLDLPPAHPDYHLLNDIRILTTVRPRWPSTLSAQLDVPKLTSYGPAFSSVLYFPSLKLVYIPSFFDESSSSFHLINFLFSYFLRIINFNFNSSSFAPSSGTAASNNFSVHLSTPANTDNNSAKLSSDIDRILTNFNLSDKDWWQPYALHNKSHDEIKAILSNSANLKIGFVRNPYDRIVSSYMYNIYKPMKTSKLYHQQLHTLFDIVLTEQLLNHTKPTFKQFVYGIKKIIQNKSNTNNHDDLKKDIKWRPQVDLIHPDLIHLDFIARYERLDTDLDVVLEWIYKRSNLRLPSDFLHNWFTKFRFNLDNTKDDINHDIRHRVNLLESLGEDEELVEMIQRSYTHDFDTFHYSTTIPDVEGVYQIAF